MDKRYSTKFFEDYTKLTNDPVAAAILLAAEWICTAIEDLQDDVEYISKTVDSINYRGQE